MQNSSPYVTPLKQSHESHIKQLCSEYYQFTMKFDRPGQMLLDELEDRQKKNIPFSWQELSIILESVIKGLRYYESVRHQHNSLSLSSIYITPKRQVLLADPWLCQQQLQLKTFQSPEKRMFENDQIDSYSDYRSSLYEAALVILSIVSEQNRLQGIQYRLTSENQLEVVNFLQTIPDLDLR